MIVDRIETFPLRIPFKPGTRSDAAAWGGKDQAIVDMLLVKVTAKDGLIGWGETFGFGSVPATKAVIDGMLAPLCIGHDASSIAPLMTKLQKKVHVFGRSGPVMFGISAIDIALWDRAGKAANAPVHQLLGGAQRHTLQTYASLMRFTDPELVRTQVHQAIQAGFHHLKLHEIELRAIQAAREEAGSSVGIMLDVNCPWSLREARVHAAALQDVGLTWLEEPIWPPENYSGLAELRGSTSIPIAAGENASTLIEFDRMMQAGAVDFVQPSPAKMGGLTELAKVATLAAARNVTLMIHTFYDRPGLLAAIHATAVLGSNDSMVEWRRFDLEAQLYGSELVLMDGTTAVPKGDGLGLVPDPDVIRTYTQKNN
jgi:L-alanine-DL-glutamate epimerase-like enolase superfamily enzyme